jgi:hypothetical protein
MWRAAILLLACSSSTMSPPFLRPHPDLQYAPFDDDMGLQVAADMTMKGADLAIPAGADLSARVDLSSGAIADLSVLHDLTPSSGDLSGLSTCKTLLAASPGLPSGSYSLQTATGQLNVVCDMTTGGGGWTLVFRPLTNDYESATVDYQIPTSSTVWSGASETLIAYRDGSNNVVGDWAQFALPADWKVMAPFQYAEKDATVSVIVSGAAAVSRTLHYGSDDFYDVCTDPWWGTGTNWGRICIENTKAPFFNSFNSILDDGCDDSSQSYRTVLCSSSRQFTIGIR